MKTQRITKHLGLNRSADKEEVYLYIENVLGIKEKPCSRGSKRPNQYGLAHEGPNPLPIRSFNLDRAYVDTNGTVHIERGIGLQPACIACDGSYRRGRLDKNRALYSKMSAEEVYAHYRATYGATAHCSKCGKDKEPQAFALSIGMEKGLHNHCMECSRSYSEAVGNRWIIYSSDGRNAVSIKGAKCAICGSTEGLHKDHKWPLSKGGTDYVENIQILCGPHNLSKSASVHVTSMDEVSDRMISERYHPLLEKARNEGWSIAKFEAEISKQVREYLLEKKGMNDEMLTTLFQEEKKRNNRKHSVERAVRKFRQYQDIAILDVKQHIEDSN